MQSKMSSETLFEAPRKYNPTQIRVHDYLYDSAFIVSGARDYARTAFKAAMASAQLVIQPVYKTMFSEIRKFPRMHIVYHPNCRLPPHMDRSYGAYLQRVTAARALPNPELTGKDRFKFSAVPKKVLDVKTVSPEFHPPTPLPVNKESPRPRTRGTQSIYRESSAQTTPWQPDGVPAKHCQHTPEVLYLDKFQWGPGTPYRTGDLPADFHTTEIINKMRHARVWAEVAERDKFPRYMKKRNAIIGDVETKDWLFREAEIDELQSIRLELLHRLQNEQRDKQSSRTGQKLAKRWADNKRDMDRKIDHIRKARDREIRKLTALHRGGGRQGLVQRMRASRGGGSVTLAAYDPASDLHAPVARHGYQARGRHADIIYDPTLISLEDHAELSEPPAWLEQCGQNLQKSCSGHHLPRDPMKLCERETKWSEQFLENLHNDLKKARLGAAETSAGPLHVLKPRRLGDTPRPHTPEVDAVPDIDESCHQSALLLQRIIRGRAVQCLMYEGRTRAAELTEELKTTHGLQNEDKVRIAKEEARAREYNAMRTEVEQKEDAVTALVDELCGGAVSAALDFLEKELRRLKEERRQHAFILIALREKSMREAAEAGRRQKEEHRRREHDEMFKHIMGVTQETVDAYLRAVVAEGVELGAEEEAVRRARARADELDHVHAARTDADMSSVEQNELVAELVQQFLLPNAHKMAARHRIATLQEARMQAARETIFGLLDEAHAEKPTCTRCGAPLGDQCRCDVCLVTVEPKATTSRDDWRWKHAKRRPVKVKPPGERYPPRHEMRCLLNSILDDVVLISRRQLKEKEQLTREVAERIRESFEAELESRAIVEEAVATATGEMSLPVKELKYHHYMRRVIGDALDRIEPYPTRPCPRELPSAIRRAAEERAAPEDETCQCVEHPPETRSRVTFGAPDTELKRQMLPSHVRALEELKKCKCDETGAVSSRIGDVEDTTADTSDAFGIDLSSTEADEHWEGDDPEGTETEPPRTEA